MIGKGPAGFTQVAEYIDFRGNHIYEGDTVVYAAMSARSTQLVEAKVEGIAQNPGNGQYKIQLQPTGLYSRWNHHWTTKRSVWDPVLEEYVSTNEPAKVVWVMAEVVTLVP